MSEITMINARSKADRYIESIPVYTNKFEGRGIIICGGGVRLYTNAWVCINMLRRVGCHLPIELWYLGPTELDKQMIDILKPLGVQCIDALEVKKKSPVRILKGWELKAYALLHSRFKELLLLDADNMPVRNPEYLFETPQYMETGAIFWPDISRLSANQAIWNICSVPYNDEPEFESGQIVVDKLKCWKALNLSMWYNQHSDFYYRHIHGDKETFHMAFRRLGKKYAMIPYPVILENNVMYQHDQDGKIIFQHRNGHKWVYDAENKRIPGFQYEQECLEFIEQLQQLWPGFVGNQLEGRSEREKRAYTFLTGHVHNYKRVGYDQRKMTFLQNGKVDIGNAGMESFWRIFSKNENHIYLELSGKDGTTCILSLGADAAWRGRWLKHEKMFIEISPVR